MKIKFIHNGKAYTRKVIKEDKNGYWVEFYGFQRLVLKENYFKGYIK